MVHTEGGDASLDALAGEDYLYLSTTGRITGTLHRIEIWFGLSGQTAYLLSGGGNRSDWVRNLRANPSVRVRIGDREWTGVARVLGPGTDEDALAILRAVASLGISLGIATTAEGVETKEQLARVREEGCTEMQGYFFSPPRPIREIERLFLTRAEKTAIAG